MKRPDPARLVGRRVRLRRDVGTLGGRTWRKGTEMVVTIASWGCYSLKLAGAKYTLSDIIGARRKDFQVLA